MMAALLRKIRRRHDPMVDVVNEARLMDAERELRDLKSRANKATSRIEERHRRNHWQEAIEQIIQGGGGRA